MSRSKGSLLAIMILILILSGCDIYQGMDTGTLKVKLRGGTEKSRSLIWEPELDITINSLNICLTDEQGNMTSYVFDAVDHERILVLDEIPIGSYGITIDVYNGPNLQGDHIAHLQEQEDADGNLYRKVYATIDHFKDAEVDAFLVPYMEGVGSLSFEVDVSHVDSSLLLYAPRIIVDISSIDGKSLSEAVSSSIALTIDGEASGEYLVWDDGHLIISLEGHGGAPESHVFLLESLPAGWYEVSIYLESSDPVEEEHNRYWSQTYFAKVVEADTATEEDVICYDTMFETGSLELNLSEEMDPMLVTLEFEETHIIEDGYVKAFTGEQVSFSTVVQKFSGDKLIEITEGLTFFWYVNGVCVEEDASGRISADPSLFEYVFDETGVYTVSVMILCGDDLQNSALGATVSRVKVEAK